MSRKIMYLMLLVMALIGVTGCGTEKIVENKPTKIKIVATIFPAYDWTKEIIGENNDDVELKLLLDKGVDLHGRS